VRLAVFLLASLAIALANLAPTPASSAQNPLTGAPSRRGATDSGAAKNPLSGKPSTGEGSAVSGGQVETTWLGDFARWIYAMQLRANRAIAERMVAIHERKSMTPLLFAMLLALLYGAVHTLGPGHGKFVVVTYFLAREARISKGLWMGIQIAVTHVIAAVVAVFVVDFALRQFLVGAPSQLATVRMISYGLIAIIGLFMLIQAIRRARGHLSTHGHHHHGHDHRHGHSHGHGSVVKAGGRQMTLLSLSVGLVPCTGALLVMIYAIANDMMFAGYAIVAAISIGMAGMLAALAIFSIFFRRAVQAGFARRSDRPSRWAQGLEIVGGVLITAVGVLLFAGVAWHSGV
jgi:nickel/cobalt transporter (NicO) family protein